MPFLLAFGATDKHVQVATTSNGTISELSGLDSIFGYMAHPISLTVNQAGKKATLLAWRLGRCALRGLPGQCTIVTGVNQAGQLIGEQEVSESHGSVLMQQDAKGAPHGGQQHQPQGIRTA